MGMKQTTANYLKHHFLIAMPHMATRVRHTLIYLCDHNEKMVPWAWSSYQPSDLQLPTY